LGKWPLRSVVIVVPAILVVVSIFVVIIVIVSVAICVFIWVSINLHIFSIFHQLVLFVVGTGIGPWRN
jgi:hypothetical protein